MTVKENRNLNEPEKEKNQENGLLKTIKNFFAKTRNRIKIFFDQPFSTVDSDAEKFVAGFSPEDYNNLYYPELNPDDLPAVAQAIRNASVQKIAGDDAGMTIDIQQILLETKLANPESIENFCIFHFIISRAIPAMLKLRPEDHFETLDIGGGPTISQDIPLMGVVKSFIHGEFLSQNRAAVEEWRDHRCGHDWSSYHQIAGKMIGGMREQFKSVSPEVRQRLEQMESLNSDELGDLLRALITEVSMADAFKPGLGLETKDFDLVKMSKQGSVDLITSHFCVESATMSLEKWKAGMMNICQKVRPNGFLLMTTICDASWYKVGENKLPATPINSRILIDELKKNGMEVLELTELIGSDIKEVGYGGMNFVLARKIADEPKQL